MEILSQAAAVFQYFLGERNVLSQIEHNKFHQKKKDKGIRQIMLIEEHLLCVIHFTYMIIYHCHGKLIGGCYSSHFTVEGTEIPRASMWEFLEMLVNSGIRVQNFGLLQKLMFFLPADTVLSIFFCFDF